MGAAIDYRAFFNTLESKKTSGFALVGRSDYGGQIWVSPTTRQIEYTTLYEEVLGELTLPGLGKPMTINVFRIGRFEPVAK